MSNSHAPSSSATRRAATSPANARSTIAAAANSGRSSSGEGAAASRGVGSRAEVVVEAQCRQRVRERRRRAISYSPESVLDLGQCLLPREQQLAGQHAVEAARKSSAGAAICLAKRAALASARPGPGQTQSQRIKPFRSAATPGSTSQSRSFSWREGVRDLANYVVGSVAKLEIGVGRHEWIRVLEEPRRASRNRSAAGGRAAGSLPHRRSRPRRPASLAGAVARGTAAGMPRGAGSWLCGRLAQQQEQPPALPRQAYRQRNLVCLARAPLIRDTLQPHQRPKRRLVFRTRNELRQQRIIPAASICCASVGPNAKRTGRRLGLPGCHDQDNERPPDPAGSRPLIASKSRRACDLRVRAATCPFMRVVAPERAMQDLLGGGDRGQLLGGVLLRTRRRALGWRGRAERLRERSGAPADRRAQQVSAGAACSAAGTVS